MKAICHACGMAYPANPDFIGCIVECPNCGNRVELQANDLIKDTPRRPAAVETKSSFDGLGFALGIILNIPGIFIAALINGRRGAISALWGLVVDGFVVVIGIALSAMFSGV